MTLIRPSKLTTQIWSARNLKPVAYRRNSNRSRNKIEKSAIKEGNLRTKRKQNWKRKWKTSQKKKKSHQSKLEPRPYRTTMDILISSWILGATIRKNNMH